MVNFEMSVDFKLLLKRGLALFLDLVLLWFGFGLFYNFINRDHLMAYDRLFNGVMELITYLPFAMVYGFICEWLSGGYTVGKYVCGVRVYRDDGSRAGLRESFLRWAGGLVDFYLTFCLGAVISMMLSSGKKRIGDRIAKTTVILSIAAEAKG